MPVPEPDNHIADRARTLGVVLQHGGYQAPDGGVHIKDVWGVFLRDLARRLNVRMRLYAPVTTSEGGRFQHFRVDPSEGLEMRTGAGDGGKETLRRLTDELGDLDAMMLFLPTLRALAAAQAARARKVPFFVYSGLGSGDWDAEGTGRRRELYGRLERAALSSARGAIGAGAAVEARFAAFLPTFRTAPITGVVSAGAPGEKRREVLYVGSLSRRKGVPDLLSAWQDAAPEGWRLVVAGTGDLAGEVEQLAAARDDVDFRGYVAHGPELFELYRGAAIKVLPSHNEGFPRVLLEAGAHGCALASTQVGGIPNAFDAGGYHPRWFQPGDAGGLATAISSLVADEAWRDEGAQALRWFEDNFGDRDRALEAAAFIATVVPELKP